MYYKFFFRIVSKFQNIKWNNSRRVNSLAAYIESELAAIVQAGTWKNERIITSPQGTRIALLNGKKALNFCANNYLGLAVKQNFKTMIQSQMLKQMWLYIL